MENLNPEQITKWRARLGIGVENNNQNGVAKWNEDEAMKLCDMAHQATVLQDVVGEILHSSDCFCRLCAPNPYI